MAGANFRRHPVLLRYKAALFSRSLLSGHIFLHLWHSGVRFATCTLCLISFNRLLLRATAYLCSHAVSTVCSAAGSSDVASITENSKRYRLSLAGMGRHGLSGIACSAWRETVPLHGLWRYFGVGRRRRGLRRAFWAACVAWAHRGDWATPGGSGTVRRICRCCGRQAARFHLFRLHALFILGNWTGWLH